jgi:hypothetical protein
VGCIPLTYTGTKPRSSKSRESKLSLEDSTRRMFDRLHGSAQEQRITNPGRTGYLVMFDFDRGSRSDPNCISKLSLEVLTRVPSDSLGLSIQGRGICKQTQRPGAHMLRSFGCFRLAFREEGATREMQPRVDEEKDRTYLSVVRCKAQCQTCVFVLMWHDVGRKVR